MTPLSVYLVVGAVLFVDVVECARFSVSDDVMGSGADALRMKTMRNVETQELVSVVWESGGVVEDVALWDTAAGTVKHVVATHEGNATALRVGDDHYMGAILAPFANRVDNGTYEFQHESYYLVRNECNDDRCCALHGFLNNKTLTVVSTNADDTGAWVYLKYSFTGQEQPMGYPFPVDIYLNYTLLPGEFQLSATIYNPMDADPLPVSFGYHPYFPAIDVSKVVIELDPCTKWNHILMGDGDPIHGSLIPTGQVESWDLFDGKTPIGGTSELPTYYDDEYKPKLSAQVCNTLQHTIYDPLADTTITFWGDQSFRVWQLFTGSKQNWGQSAVAFEPMTGLADTFNNHDHLIILSAGEEYHGTFGLHL
ncbi:aldose 1-epimerase [Pelomyxa schiedti]|nr:aldose 1-epimerase [Pelomyxa schiedti]